MASIEAIQDILAEASTNKGLLREHLGDFLDALSDGDIVQDRVVYKVMSALVNLIREGVLETDGDVIFKKIDDLYELLDEAAQNNEQDIQKILNEVTTSLFSNCCSYLQARSILVVRFLPHILTVMLREGSTRYAGYGCVAPLLLENIRAFTDCVELLLKVMMHFPGEVLSVISELYKLNPEVFDANIHLLIQLYGESPAAQLSILHILHEIGLRNDRLVEPYLLKLRDMCDTQPARDERVIQVQEFVEDKLQNILLETATGAVKLEGDFTDSADTSASEDITVDYPPGSPALKGTLRKRGRRFGRMSRRFFTLDDGYINFFKSSKKDKPTRRVPLTEVVNVTSDPRHPYAFVLQTKTRTVVLAASSDKEKEMWVNAIGRQSHV